ncbi:unnamed protein product [Blepharisma stoltei]|uniref:Translin-associated factor X-interacting protein 1 N-terminal domain-containing protein n=1 Tax=Blepharisma stoltei TaxID=1481888 RepID=A0AAU9K6S2_9CILI|nr:unnamed protein product [Blepharisma stoltei]
MIHKQKSMPSLLSLNYSSHQNPKAPSTSASNIKAQLIKFSPYAEPSVKSRTVQIRKKEASPLQLRHGSPGIINSSSFQINSSKPKHQANIFSSFENNYSSPTNAKNIGKSMNFSMNSSLNASHNVYKESGVSQSRLNTAATEAQILEGRLSQKLREFSTKNSSRISDKLEIFRDIFQEIIKKDSTYSSLLSKIRNAYDEVIEDTQKKMTTDLNSRLSELNSKLAQAIEEKRSLEKKVEKLSQEKYETEIWLKEITSQNNKLQNQLQKSSISKKSCPEIDENAVNSIIDENKSLTKIFKKMKTEIDNFKYKEKQLLKLVIALKKNGYPVEEIYDREVQKSKTKKHKSREYSELWEESEDEQLVSGRPKEVQRPHIVPKLNLNEVKPETPSNYSDSDESSSVSNARSI